MYNSLEKPRKIFFENLGNKDLMRENEQLSDYEKYKISYEIETKWKAELIQNLLESIENKSEYTVSIIKNLKVIITYFEDFDIYKVLINNNEKNTENMDLLELIFYAEELINMLYVFIAQDLKAPLNELVDCIENIQLILSEVIENNQNRPNNLYKKLTKYGLELKENYVQNRAKKKLREILSLKIDLEEDFA